MQTIAELEARALRRADEVDDLARRLAAAECQAGARQHSPSVDRGGRLWSRIAGWFRGDGVAARIAQLRVQKAHADAAMKIAVDELHQAHCIALRGSPWSRTVLKPAEAVLTHATDDYHPWDRVLMFGDAALRALTVAARQPGADVSDIVGLALMALLALGGTAAPRLSGTSTMESVEIIHGAGEAVDRFIASVRLLERDAPGDVTIRASPTLADHAARMKRVRTKIGIARAHRAIQAALREIGAIMTRVRAQSSGERGQLGDARQRFEQASRQVASMAWSKIPARLRPNR
jgi:hypothetical protein